MPVPVDGNFTPTSRHSVRAGASKTPKIGSTVIFAARESILWLFLPNAYRVETKSQPKHGEAPNKEVDIFIGTSSTRKPPPPTKQNFISLHDF